MMPHRILSSVFLCAVGATIACSHNPPPQSATGVTSAQRTDLQTATSRYVEARCKHAKACNEIGADAKYASRDACMNDVRGDAENSLRQSHCPNGVDTTRLEACLSAISAEACSGIGSGTARSMECATSALCP